ncbi:TPA: ATP-binding protein [Methanosarcinaceae archaeon]|nr:ATP-binding protein [Methanosarcinaceae archaeon]
MLLEFSVENFLSFKDRVSLSLDSSASKKLSCNLIEVSEKERLLKSAVVYGANASGKSNLVKALFFMRNMVVHSHNFNIDTRIPVKPFRLDRECLEKPSRFELKFVHEGVRYRYGFSCNGWQVIDEYLFERPGKRERAVFKRKNSFEKDSSDKGISEFHFSVDKKQQELISSQTIEKTLYISRATQLGYEKTKPVYEFFTGSLQVSLTSGWENYILERMCADEAFKARVIEVLKKADFGGIEEIMVKKVKSPSPGPEFVFEYSPTDAFKSSGPAAGPAAMSASGYGGAYSGVYGDSYEVRTRHRTESGDAVYFDLREESEGTRKTLTLLGPLFDVMDKGGVLFIDELESSLHPEITRLLIRLFNSKKNSRAQMVFTTHDTNVLDNELFRRDQIYFCTKEPNRHTELASLLDFDIRQEIDFERVYLTGRVGGVPIVDETLLY